jgi:hypothetical protein
MPIESPDIEAFRQYFEVAIEAAQKHKADSHAAIKTQSMLNVTIYVMATRFLEGSVKHIVYNCCKMMGYSSPQLIKLEQELKSFNNPEFSNIKDLFQDKLGYDITQGLINGDFKQSDITFLNQIVQNRHRNVHASPDSTEWYNQNKKDINNFLQEYPGLLSVIEYLSTIVFTPSGVSKQQKKLPKMGSNTMVVTISQPKQKSKNNLWSKFISLWS